MPRAGDLSAGQATSVQNIVQLPPTHSRNNTTTFDFAGSGFSDANQSCVSVNLGPVSPTSTTLGNGPSTAAIQNARQLVPPRRAHTLRIGISRAALERGSETAQAAFGVLIYRQCSGFQVQAGIVLANALLGNNPGRATGAYPQADGVALADPVNWFGQHDRGTTAVQSTIPKSRRRVDLHQSTWWSPRHQRVAGLQDPRSTTKPPLDAAAVGFRSPHGTTSVPWTSGRSHERGRDRIFSVERARHARCETP